MLGTLLWVLVVAILLGMIYICHHVHNKYIDSLPVFTYELKSIRKEKGKYIGEYYIKVNDNSDFEEV